MCKFDDRDLQLEPEPLLEPTAAHEIEIASLKRKIARQAVELELYRLKYPGWRFVPEIPGLMSDGTTIEDCLFGED